MIPTTITVDTRMPVNKFLGMPSLQLILGSLGRLGRKSSTVVTAAASTAEAYIYQYIKRVFYPEVHSVSQSKNVEPVRKNMQKRQSFNALISIIREFTAFKFHH